jgi:alkanesulfonate monooxygenase SsuD/methylene tetrahydromethanopterin reductase-like flavin-dependent oxidoreductase (luciferase family)
MPDAASAEPADELTIVGSSTAIADVLQHWFAVTGIDGFLVMPATAPEGAAAFVDGVVPLLRHRKLLREGYTGSTLRDHLGLLRPELVSPNARGLVS